MALLISPLVGQAVDWTTSNPGRVNDYMEVLVKETATLHKVLSRYLAAPVVEVRDFFLFWYPTLSAVSYQKRCSPPALIRDLSLDWLAYRRLLFLFTYSCTLY